MTAATRPTVAMTTRTTAADDGAERGRGGRRTSLNVPQPHYRRVLRTFTSSVAQAQVNFAGAEADLAGRCSHQQVPVVGDTRCRP